MKHKINCLDLFCGAGGFSYGFMYEDINILLGIDNDNKAIETYNNNHNGVGIVKDLREMKTKEVLKLIPRKNIDIIIGGPPCQGLSLSGPRMMDDPRNQLYKSFVKIVRDIKPEVVVLENVPGLVSLFKGNIKNAILDEFTSLGYQMDYKILRASDFGVPQHRRRVFFVGMRNKFFKFPVPCYSDEIELPTNMKRMITCSEALSDLPLLDNETFIGSDIQEYLCEPQNDFQQSMRTKSKYVYNHIASVHSDKIRNIIRLVPPGKNYKALPEHLQETRKFNVAWTRFPENAPAPTIDTGHRHHFHYSACRVPTVRECARIQSFPDHFIFTKNKSQQFRQVGNAVPPLLAMHLAKEIICQI